MAKVVLFVVEDPAGPGIRALGSVLKESGHNPLLFFVGRKTHEGATAIPENHETKPSDEPTFRAFKSFHFVWQKKLPQRLPQSFLNFFAAQKPDIIGFSTRFLETRYQTFFAELRQAAPGALLVAGGHGPSVQPEAFLEMGCDCVIRGEGEEALLELADARDSGRNYEHIQNLSFMKQGKYIQNRLREPVKDLSSLPLPLRQTSGIYRVEEDVVYQGDYKHHNDAWLNMMLAGRGCIGACSYCAAPLWRNIYTEQGCSVAKHRRRSNEHVLREALEMKKNGATTILFMDDYFIRPYAEMLDFFRQWRKKIALPIFIHFSADQLAKHPDLLTHAIDAGLTILDLALQSGDEDFCSRIFDRNNNNKGLLRFFHEAYDHFLPIMAEFIDGYLIDGYDDLESKLDFIRQLPPFDPAFRYATTISVTQLKVHEGSPLSRRYPNSNSLLLSYDEFIYRAMLMHFRIIMSDAEFANFRAKSAPKKNPRKLLAHFHMLLSGRHNAYIASKAKEQEGKEVFFFGCGEIYQARKHMFAGTKPRAILVDRPVPELVVDGLEVLQMRDVLPQSERIPIVIFSAYAQDIARKIKKLRPDYERADIISCETSE